MSGDTICIDDVHDAIEAGHPVEAAEAMAYMRHHCNVVRETCAMIADAEKLVDPTGVNEVQHYTAARIADRIRNLNQ